MIVCHYFFPLLSTTNVLDTALIKNTISGKTFTNVSNILDLQTTSESLLEELHFENKNKNIWPNILKKI